HPCRIVFLHCFPRHVTATLPLSHNTTPLIATLPLSLHDALPISCSSVGPGRPPYSAAPRRNCVTAPSPRDVWTCFCPCRPERLRDRKSTRLNSSHVSISYAVFCLKKKK